MSIGFLYDVSGSMSSEYVKDLNDATQAIYETVRSQSGDNEYFLIGFNKNVIVLADWTSDPEVMSDGLKRLPKKGAGNTAVYDACFTALEKLNSSGKHKKVLIMFTDGTDNNSVHKRNEIIKLASTSPVLIYAVTLRERPRASLIPAIQPMGGWEFLYEITGMTGGTTLFVDSGSSKNIVMGLEKPKFELAFEKVFSELRSQYAIQYLPAEEKNKAHSVDIKVAIPAEMKKGKGDVSLRYRKKFKAT
jgi:VWFA-related protein